MVCGLPRRNLYWAFFFLSALPQSVEPDPRAPGRAGDRADRLPRALPQQPGGWTATAAATGATTVTATITATTETEEAAAAVATTAVAATAAAAAFPTAVATRVAAREGKLPYQIALLAFCITCVEITYLHLIFLKVQHKWLVRSMFVARASAIEICLELTTTLLRSLQIPFSKATELMVFGVGLVYNLAG